MRGELWLSRRVWPAARDFANGFEAFAMKFKAVVTRERFEILNALVNALSKVGPQCAVLLSRDELQFAANEESQSTESLYIFATLEPTQIFSEFRVESRANNQVAFVIVLENLQRALQSGRQAAQVVFKLATKQGSPHLVIETTADRIDVCHDIPIQLIKVSSMEEHYPPQIDEPQAQIEMAPPQSLRAVMDRMKLLHDLVQVDVDMEQGRMTFSVATDNVTMRTFYHDLEDKTPGESQRHASEHDDEREGGCAKRNVSVKLNSRQFVRTLNFANMHSESTVCCITEGQAMQLHVHLWQDIGCISYVIPVLNECEGK